MAGASPPRGRSRAKRTPLRQRTQLDAQKTEASPWAHTHYPIASGPVVGATLWELVKSFGPAPSVSNSRLGSLDPPSVRTRLRPGGWLQSAARRTSYRVFGYVAVTVAVKRLRRLAEPVTKSAEVEIKVAEGEGFEPPEALPPQRFSRPPQSTALPSLPWWSRTHCRHRRCLDA